MLLHRLYITKQVKDLTLCDMYKVTERVFYTVEGFQLGYLLILSRIYTIELVI